MTRDTFDRFRQPERGRFGDNERAPAHSRVTGASDLVDLTLTLRMEKPLSIAVTDPAKPSGAWIWLPKSAVEFEKKDARGTVVVTMPEWLADQKGLL